MDRKDLIDETSKLCDELIAVAKVVPRDIERYELLVADLLDRIDHLAEFSTVTEQVLCEKGVLNDVVSHQAMVEWRAADGRTLKALQEMEAGYGER